MQLSGWPLDISIYTSNISCGGDIVQPRRIPSIRTKLDLAVARDIEAGHQCIGNLISSTVGGRKCRDLVHRKSLDREFIFSFLQDMGICPCVNGQRLHIRCNLSSFLYKLKTSPVHEECDMLLKSFCLLHNQAMT